MTGLTARRLRSVEVAACCAVIETLATLAGERLTIRRPAVPAAALAGAGVVGLTVSSRPVSSGVYLITAPSRRCRPCVYRRATLLRLRIAGAGTPLPRRQPLNALSGPRATVKTIQVLRESIHRLFEILPPER